VVFLLLLISGAFSGTEVAFTSLSLDQIEELKRDHGKRGALVADLYDKLDVVLTSITIGNNMANLAASALVSAFTIRLFGEAWLTVSTVALTILVLIIGEVTPKQIGILHNQSVTLRLSRFLRLFSLLFAPIIWFIRLVSNTLTRLVGGSARPKITRDSLRHLVRYASRTGVLSQLDTSIVKNVLRSSGSRVEAIMTHRTRIFSLERKTRVRDAFAAMIENGYSRVPVYEDDPERVVGIALLKDVAEAVVDGRDDLLLARLVATPIYVHETWPVDQVLGRLKRERLNMAIVLDEYGGVSGLVTMEDLVEVFVGDLYDEGEAIEGQRITRVGDNEFLVRADTPIFVFNDHLDVDLPSEGEAQTVGGFLTEKVGRIPMAGEKIETDTGTFTIDSVTHSSIQTVRFIKILLHE
jgi:CBS domain containing-hemolysin-like protein